MNTKAMRSITCAVCHPGGAAWRWRSCRSSRDDKSSRGDNCRAGSTFCSMHRHLPSAIAGPALAGLFALAVPAIGEARTVYECMRDNTLSLATAPEPGSRCVPKRVNDRRAKVPNFWGDLGPIRSPHYQRRINGRMVISTRRMAGWTQVDSVVSLKTPRDSWAHVGLGTVGKPRLGIFDAQFKAAARKTGIEEAWLRAIAHAESDFNATAVSPKGAQGVMQLMPQVTREYGVANPFSSAESIDCGARHLKALIRRYRGDMVLVAAA
ncbi:MAG TPA: lytic transglycosylase domain-containing protein, partial [Lysobacter sp.]|nr:lytic transglycosylase domain-containing protein [Lysobacter sp.]